MQNGCDNPQQWQASTEVSHGVGSPMANATANFMTTAIDYKHFVHQIVVSKIRITLSNSLVVQRDERQSPSKSIQLVQSDHASCAESAIPIENNDIAIGPLIRVR
jgi:hypothetical protein